MKVGKQLARPISAEVGETSNQAVYIEFIWQMSEGGDQVKDRWYITRKGGEMLDRKVDQLKDVFGWNGEDPFWFTDNQAELPEVEVVLEAKDWTDRKGQLRAGWQVGFINPIGGGSTYTGSPKIDRATFATKYGATFRAMATTKQAAPQTPGATTGGTAKAPGPASRAKGVQTPETKTTPPARTMKGKREAATSTKEECWALMEGGVPATWKTEAERDTAWFNALDEAANKPEAEFTPEEWGVVKKSICATLALPF